MLGIIVYMLLGFVVGRKYLHRIFHKQIIEVTKNELIIVDRFLFASQRQKFSIPDISNIRFNGPHQYIKHPLEGDTFDYTGFGVAEKEIQNLTDDGMVEFFYKGGIIRFGKNLSSQDAEDLISTIEKFTGNNLQLDDKMEKLLKDLDHEISEP